MKHASIFSGIGGPEIAAAMLGWENVFHCEINDFCKKILEYWFPNATSYGNIFETDFTTWQGKVDILTGGFPCQPFSTAGKRRGKNDNRYLWPQMLRVISEVKPTWVIGENVAGILSMVEPGKVSSMASQSYLFEESDGVQRYRQEQPFTIQRICTDIENLGYEVQPILIPACAIEAPHRRDRVFIIAHAKNTLHVGLQGIEKLGHDRQQGNTWTTSNDGEIRQPSTNSPSTNTNGDRERERDKQIQSQFADASKPERSYREQYAPNATGKRRRELQNEGKTQRKCNRDVLLGICRGLSYEVGERWKNFPTVSPIHRGNDGLPFDVDDLTISWGKNNVKKKSKKLAKWRTESLKAYGNAIVPQVMYEIFRAIEIVSK